MIRLLLALLALAAPAGAATIVAQGLTVAALEAAQTAATAGDTIILPVGDESWAGAFTATKNLTWQGAGVDQTVLRRTDNGSAATIAFDLGATTSWLRGVTIIHAGTVGASACVRIRGQNVRISECRLVGSVQKVLGIILTGATGASIVHPTGVGYNLRFEGARIADMEGDIGPTGGSRIWANSDAVAVMGGANAWFTEDSYCDKVWDDGANIIDHNYGGHTVTRYNTIIDGTIYGHSFDDSTPANHRGTRFVEVYGNTIRQVNFTMGEGPVVINAGTAAIWGNTITGTWNSPVNRFQVSYDDPRSGNDGRDGNTAVANGTGSHTGSSDAAVLTDATKAWTVNAYAGLTVYNLTDGSLGTIISNTATTVTATLAGGTQNDWDTSDTYKITDGWPLRDQPGTTTDASLWDGSTLPAPAQTLAPMYEWNNTLNGADIDFVITTGREVWIVAGRDYFNDTVMPGYTPYTYPHPLRTAATPTPVVRAPGKRR